MKHYPNATAKQALKIEFLETLRKLGLETHDCILHIIKEQLDIMAKQNADYFGENNGNR